jgi:hypothetical protein
MLLPGIACAVPRKAARPADAGCGGLCCCGGLSVGLSLDLGDSEPPVCDVAATETVDAAISDVNPRPLPGSAGAITRCGLVARGGCGTGGGGTA